MVNKEKYQNAILYFIRYCNNGYLGKTKLFKLLYYLDFIFYRDHKKSVTGDEYIHNEYGPVPEIADEVLVELKQHNKINIEAVPYKDGEKLKFKHLEDPDSSVFNKEEVQLLKNISTEFELWSTEKIVSQTHIEAPWFYSKPYEGVDFNYASDIEFFLDNVQHTAKVEL